MAIPQKQESFLSLLRERNKRREDGRETTLLDMLRKRRKLLEIRRTRVDLIRNEQENDK